jgi:hypothetical protein
MAEDSKYLPKPDKSQRPYTMEDLSIAIGDYNAAKGSYDKAMQMVMAKRSEMDSFQRTADLALVEVERYERIVHRVVSNLERKP